MKCRLVQMHMLCKKCNTQEDILFSYAGVSLSLCQMWIVVSQIDNYTSSPFIYSITEFSNESINFTCMFVQHAYGAVLQFTNFGYIFVRCITIEVATVAQCSLVWGHAWMKQ